MPGSKAENLLRLPLRRLRFVEWVLTVTQTLTQTAGQGRVQVPLRLSHRIEKGKNRAFTRLGGEQLKCFIFGVFCSIFCSFKTTISGQLEAAIKSRFNQFEKDLDFMSSEWQGLPPRVLGV